MKALEYMVVPWRSVCFGITLLTFTRQVNATTEYPTCTQLGSAINGHACLHAQFGSFGDGTQPYPLASSASTSFAASTPNVNAVHTLYAVTLTAGGPGAWTGTVKYRPARSGDWAIYVTPDPPVPAPPSGTSAPAVPPPPRPTIPISVLDPANAVVPIELQHDNPSCDRLPRVYTVHLTALTTYRIILGASPVATVGVAFEKLGDFETTVGADADGDGFGNPAAALATPCLPPPGYVANATDCDDTLATVHPGAVEICDQRDSNCNGTVDENCPVHVPASPPGWLLALSGLVLAAGLCAFRRPAARRTTA